MMGRPAQIMTPGQGVALRDLLTQSKFNQGRLAEQPNEYRRAQEAHDAQQAQALADVGIASDKRATEGRQRRAERGKETAKGAWNLYNTAQGDPETKTAQMRAFMNERLDEYVRSGQAKRDGVSDAEIQQGREKIAGATSELVGSIAMTTEQAMTQAADARDYPSDAPTQQTGGVPLSNVPGATPGMPQQGQDQSGGLPLSRVSDAELGVQAEWAKLTPEERDITGFSPEIRAQLGDQNMVGQGAPTQQQGVPLDQVTQAPEAAPAPAQQQAPASQLERDLAEADKTQGRGGKASYERAKEERADAYKAEEIRMKQDKVKADAKTEKTKVADHFDKLGKEKKDLESKMSKDFVAGSKVFIDTRDAYSRIKVSAQDPSAAGDLSMIFNYMKMLDPGSTVREGEFATAQNAAGVPERVKAFYANILRGERMTPPQRSDFLTRSEKIYGTILANHDKFKAQWETRAKDNGLDVSDVVMDFTPAKQDSAPILKVGDIESDGEGTKYKFLGGDPAQEKNWKKVK